MMTARRETHRSERNMTRGPQLLSTSLPNMGPMVMPTGMHRAKMPIPSPRRTGGTISATTVAFAEEHVPHMAPWIRRRMSMAATPVTRG
jgi:hypothetical protein